ncbi:MAG: hypothetical protein FWC64_02305 [Treponema sp.]|nr:hypothetical protein [Treponema sp.]
MRNNLWMMPAALLLALGIVFFAGCGRPLVGPHVAVITITEIPPGNVIRTGEGHTPSHTFSVELTGVGQMGQGIEWVVEPAPPPNRPFFPPPPITTFEEAAHFTEENGGNEAILTFAQYADGYVQITARLREYDVPSTPVIIRAVRGEAEVNVLNMPLAETVRRGEYFNFQDSPDFSISGANHPNIGDLTWTLEEGTLANPHMTTTGSIINPFGVLTVLSNEAERTITVVATPDYGVAGPARTTVTIPPTATGVVITDAAGAAITTFVNVPRASRHELYARVESPANDAPQGIVSWEITGGNFVGTRIDADNGLIVHGIHPEDEEFITVRATVAASDVHTLGGGDLSATFNVRATGDMQHGDWAMVRVGIDHTMAITWRNRADNSGGELYTWGRGEHGQLGHDSRTSLPNPTGDNRPAAYDRNLPTRVAHPPLPAGHYWTYVSGGWAHTVALRSDGTIWGTGRIFYTGFGNLTNMVVDVSTGLTDNLGGSGSDGRMRQLDPRNGWVAIHAAHATIFAIRQEGSSRFLYSMGSNNYNVVGLGGERGDHVTELRRLPGNDWGSVAAGWHHALALRTDGRLYGWGNNTQFQLTNGVSSDGSNVPVPVGNPAWRWSSVSAGNQWSAGIRDGGGAENRGLFTWGNSGNGRLGRTGTSYIPGRVTAPMEFSSIDLNNTSHGVAIQHITGALFTWGSNVYGQLGRLDNTGGQGDYPVRITRALSLDEDLDDTTLWHTSIGGGSFSLAIDSEGYLWAWGHNAFGMLGDGTTTNRTRPVRIIKP